MGRKKIYQTEEEKKKAQKEANKRCYQKHIEERRTYSREYQKKYYSKNKQNINEKAHIKMFQEPLRRAKVLLYEYNRADKKRGLCEGNLTPQWIVDNIFTKPCAHCGKAGWQVIGCNRIDDDKPHTIDNVEPCCQKCNSKMNAISTNRDSLGKFI